MDSSAYRALVTMTEPPTDPSETLNLIDQARADAQHTTPTWADLIYRKCDSVELDVHLLFTPISLALRCCE